MESVKPLVYVLLLLCSAVVVCSERDPLASKKWRTERRTLAPRLSNGQWRPCCAPAEIRNSCRQAPRNGEEALALLERAQADECLDAALAAIEKHTPADLAAAYFVRAQRRGDPVDFLRALAAAEETLQHDADSQTARFNRALALEKLGLAKEAILAWDDLWKRERSEWSKEARARRDALLALREGKRWPEDQLKRALEMGDRDTVTRVVREFPSPSLQHFERTYRSGAPWAPLFASVFLDAGEPYARAIVDAADQSRDRKALEEGIGAFAEAQGLAARSKRADSVRALERSAALLKKAANPLHLAVQYELARQQFLLELAPLPLLDSIAPTADAAGYRDLGYRIHLLRATALEFEDRYVEALQAYERAQALAPGHNANADVLVRRSANYDVVGSAGLAFRDSFRALSLLPYTTDLNTRHQTYASAAAASRRLGYPGVALKYRNAAVEAIQKATVGASPNELTRQKRHLGVALRARADLHIELSRDAAAETDLLKAAELAKAADSEAARKHLQMRLAEVRGQALLKKRPTAAAAQFKEAIALAGEQDSTYRAVLHFKRAAARRNAGDVHADEDVIEAFRILRSEAKQLLDSRSRGYDESLWTPYFSRFQAMYREMVESRLAADDVAGAFLYAEQARAFEPLQLVLQSHEPPPGFRRLETRSDLQQQLDALPADTVILQYLVLDERTYTWVLSRGSLRVVSQRVERKDIERWGAEVNEALRSGRRDLFDRAMSAAYTELIEAPLATVNGRRATRFVIVPDGPMHALPLAALRRRGEYLVRRGSVSVAGSTSLYLYALARDRQFSSERPAVLIAANPRIHESHRLAPLPYAIQEAHELSALYGGERPLVGAEATIPRFVAAARKSGIVHFAGHGLANAQSPWRSMLLLTPQGNDRGELTAEKLMRELSSLERTRLVVLGACSTAGGQPIGPEGVAPLVRPLIAANVPAVVGTLWDVQDATAKPLLVSFHRHYRHGDDVATALRYAQLEMLRNNPPATTWAPFQVIGHAASPYARSAASEERHNDHLRIENSLHRPDGLHSQ